MSSAVAPAKNPSAAHPPSLCHSVPPSRAEGAPDFRAIPDTLRRANRWLTWRYEQTPDGRWKKGFFRPGMGRAIYDDFRSWTTFPDAQAAYQRSRHAAYPYDGIAFALGDGFTAIELNEVFKDPTADVATAVAGGPSVSSIPCATGGARAPQNEAQEQIPENALGSANRNPVSDPPSLPPSVPPSGEAASREAHPWSSDLISDLKTYTELAPDGRSLTLICCDPSSAKLDFPPVEPVPHPEGGTFAAYHRAHHVCITGRQWPLHTGYAVEDRNLRFQQIVRQLHQGTKIEALYPGAPPPPPLPPAPVRRVEAQAMRPITPFAGLPTREEIRARRKAAERRNQPAQPRLLTALTEADLRAERAVQLRRGRLRRNSESAGPPATDEIFQFAFENFRLGRTQAGEPFVVERAGPNIAYMFRGGADPLRALLIRRVIRDLGRAPKPHAVGAALALLHAEALAAPIEEVHLRVAKILNPEPRTLNSQTIVIDLGRTDGRTVIVTADGWKVVDRSPVLFRRTRLTREMPIPERGGRLDDFRKLLNVSDETWPLLRGWLVAALFPSIPHPILLLGGVQGTGKSSALHMLCGLVDPSPAPLRTPSRDLDRWAAMAASSWCVPLDNVSSISSWFSDALCKAVTGDGFICKQHADDDLTVVQFRRVIAMSSIDPGPLRGDLADRLLLVEYDPIDDRRRRPDELLFEDFQQQKPFLLGALLDEVSAVLRRLPHVRLQRLPRMADFARILVALPRIDVRCATGGASALPIKEQEQEASNASGYTETPNTKHQTLPAHSFLASPEANPPSLSPSVPPSLPLSVPGVPSTPSPLPPGPSPLLSDKHSDELPDELNAPNATPDELDELDELSLAIYLRQLERLTSEVIEGDAIACALTEFMQTRPSWTGTMTELLLAVKRPKPIHDWPKSPQALTARLKRLAPSLKTMGIAVDYGRTPDRLRTRQIHLTSRPVETTPR